MVVGVVGPDVVESDALRIVGLRLAALDRHVGEASAHESERNPAAERHRFHTGQCSNALEHPPVERAPIVGRVPRGEKIEPADDNSVGLKPRRHPRRGSETADAQAGANEQGNRQGDLRGNKCAAETMAGKRSSRVSRIAKRRREMGRGGQRGRSEREQEHGADGNGCGEPQDLRVDRHVELDRQLRGRRESDQQPRSSTGARAARRRCRDRRARRPSTSNCWTIRQRPAPIERRIAISRCRAVARASRSPARLAHAISSTTTATAISISRTGRSTLTPPVGDWSSVNTAARCSM